MEKLIPKEDLEKAMKMEGEARGAAIREHLDYILQKEGKEGLGKIEKELAGVGLPRYGEIKNTNFYPIGLYALTHEAIEKIFHYNEAEFEDMGRFNAKFSLVIRLFMRYFVSLEKITKEVSNMWRRYYTVGTLTAPEYDAEKKYVILRLEDFAPYPTYCYMVRGYFAELLEIIVKTKVAVKETKCIFRGDQYNEFLLTWE